MFRPVSGFRFGYHKQERFSPRAAGKAGCTLAIALSNAIPILSRLCIPPSRPSHQLSKASIPAPFRSDGSASSLPFLEPSRRNVSLRPSILCVCQWPSDLGPTVCAAQPHRVRAPGVPRGAATALRTPRESASRAGTLSQTGLTSPPTESDGHVVDGTVEMGLSAPRFRQCSLASSDWMGTLCRLDCLVV